jgi:sugar/nucleoside kinase (ribokinase family)
MRSLAVAGNVNVDLIMGTLPPWPAPGTEVFVDHDEMRPGGAAGNVALAWRALGVDFQIAGNVGNDQFGEYLKTEFGDLAARWPVAAAATTYSVGLTHPDGERTFITTRGHLAAFSGNDVIACLDATALSGGILLVCGVFLLPGIERDFETLATWADAHDIAIALDTGWPPRGWTTASRAAAKRWLARSRYALFNEVEACAVTETDEAEDAADALLGAMAAPQAQAVVKRGRNGAIGANRAEGIVRVSADDVAVIDTIGAGDAFNAGFLFATARDEPLDRAVRSGVSTASAAISTAPRSYAVAAMISEGYSL